MNLVIILIRKTLSYLKCIVLLIFASQVCAEVQTLQLQRPLKREILSQKIQLLINEENQSFLLTQTEKSKFSQIHDKFERASFPQKQKLEGVWAGRCYSKDKPDFALGNLLIAKENIQTPHKEQKHGPLFSTNSSENIFNLAIVNLGLESSETRFDDLSPTDAAKVEEFTQFNFPNRFASSWSESEFVTVKDENSNLGYLFRQTQDFVFTKVIVLSDDEIYTSGDIAYMCYFFKNSLKNK